MDQEGIVISKRLKHEVSFIARFELFWSIAKLMALWLHVYDHGRLAHGIAVLLNNSPLENNIFAALFGICSALGVLFNVFLWLKIETKSRVPPQLFLYYQVFQILLNSWVFISRFKSVWSLLAFIVNVTNLYFYSRVTLFFKQRGGSSIYPVEWLNLCGCT